MPSISTTAQGPKRLFHLVYTLARKEAREARERRDLPFGGLFCTSAPQASGDYLPLVAAERRQAPGYDAAR